MREDKITEQFVANQKSIDTDKKICVGEKLAVVSYDEYMEVVRENEELKETIVKLVKKLNVCGILD